MTVLETTITNTFDNFSNYQQQQQQPEQNRRSKRMKYDSVGITVTDEREYVGDENDDVTEFSSTPLHTHAFNGNKKHLQDAILSREYDLNELDHTGRTPLIYSILVEQVDCFNLLLKHGADIEKPDSDGRTALHWAAYQGNHKLVKLIISKCKNKTSRDKEGRTPLHLALSHDNLRVMNFILKELDRNEIDSEDNRGMTALGWSVYYERIDHINLLLRHGASVNVMDHEGRGILHWTSQNKDPTIIKLLLAEGYGEINFKDKDGRTLLHLAVGQGNMSIIEYLLSLKNVLINQEDNMKRTPLHWAAVLGFTAIVELLLKCGADYMSPDNNGLRPLLYAVQNNKKDVVETMITTGRVTDEPDNEQRTALMWGALKGHVDVLRVLLENRCGDINATDINHQTALHMSCRTGNFECVDLLIKHQADINVLDKQDHIPLVYACGSGHAHIVAVLLSQNDQMNLNRRDQEGRTPLHYSAMVDRREIVNNLISHGLDPNVRDNSGSPPLHIAAFSGNVHCMNVLLEHNALVNMQNNSGSTALHLACRSGNLDAVKLLVTRYKANMNIMDYSAEMLTCLDYAILNDHQDVSFFLIETGANRVEVLHDMAAKIQIAWRRNRKYKVEKWHQFQQMQKQQQQLQLQHQQHQYQNQQHQQQQFQQQLQQQQQQQQQQQRNFGAPQYTSIGGSVTSERGNNSNLRVLSPLPPVSPTHQIVPHTVKKASSHIGMPTRPRAGTQVSLVSGVSAISSRSSTQLTPEKSKYVSDSVTSLSRPGSKKGPKFFDADTTNSSNPFSLNRVARVKSPVMDVTPRAKSTTGVMAPYRPPPTMNHNLGNSMNSGLPHSRQLNSTTGHKLMPLRDMNATRQQQQQQQQHYFVDNSNVNNNNNNTNNRPNFLELQKQQPLPQIDNSNNNNHRNARVEAPITSSQNENTNNNNTILHNNQYDVNNNNNHLTRYPPHDTHSTRSGASSDTSAYFQASQSYRRPLPIISVHNEDATTESSISSASRIPPNDHKISANHFVPEPPTRERLNTSKSNYSSVSNNSNGNSTTATAGTATDTNKPWNVYRRDQKRIHIIRLKTNAAVKIQTFYRAYRHKKTTTRRTSQQQQHQQQQVVRDMSIDDGSSNIEQTAFVDEDLTTAVRRQGSSDTVIHAADNGSMYGGSESGASLLSVDSTNGEIIPDDGTLFEIAALVIQAAWRQYLKMKLLYEAKRTDSSNGDSSVGNVVESNDTTRTRDGLSGYSYELKKPKRSTSVDLSTGNDDIDDEESWTASGRRHANCKEKRAREKTKSLGTRVTNSFKTDSKYDKNRNDVGGDKQKGKKKLMPSSSFPLMENIYRENVRVKRTKRFSIKNRLMQKQETVTEDESPPPDKNVNVNDLSKDELKALRAGKPKLLLKSHNVNEK